MTGGLLPCAGASTNATREVREVLNARTPGRAALERGGIPLDARRDA